jgi:hypothetical protein
MFTKLESCSAISELEREKRLLGPGAALAISWATKVIDPKAPTPWVPRFHS